VIADLPELLEAYNQRHQARTVASIRSSALCLILDAPHWLPAYRHMLCPKPKHEFKGWRFRVATHPHVNLVHLSEEGLDAFVVAPIMQEQEARIARRDKRRHQKVVEAVNRLESRAANQTQIIDR
jgi:hypothetical protein